jgi:hypothetical protein
MPSLLIHRVHMPRSSWARACFEHIIFTGENRYSDQQALPSDPAYRKFSGDCSWDPGMGKRRARRSQMWTQTGAQPWRKPTCNTSRPPRRCMWTGSSRGSTRIREPRRARPALPHSRRPAVCPLPPRLFEIPLHPSGILGLVSSPTNRFSTTKMMSNVPSHTPEAYGLTPLVGGTLARGLHALPGRVGQQYPC